MVAGGSDVHELNSGLPRRMGSKWIVHSEEASSSRCTGTLQLRHVCAVEAVIKRSTERGDHRWSWCHRQHWRAFVVVGWHRRISRVRNTVSEISPARARLCRSFAVDEVHGTQCVLGIGEPGESIRSAGRAKCLRTGTARRRILTVAFRIGHESCYSTRPVKSCERSNRQVLEPLFGGLNWTAAAVGVNMPVP